MYTESYTRIDERQAKQVLTVPQNTPPAKAGGRRIQCTLEAKHGKAAIMGEVIAKALLEHAPDQAAIVAGKKGDAVVVDCRTQTMDWGSPPRHVGLPPKGASPVPKGSPVE